MAALLLVGGAPGVAQESPGRVELLSPVYEVRELYRSMQGPQSTQQIHLRQLTEDRPELLWITGYEATMVGADGTRNLSQEFMCHSNLDFDPGFHNQQLGLEKQISSRLFTLSQGQLAIELPAGFGVPVASTEALSLTTQVLNLNRPEADLAVRHLVALDLLRDAELSAPLRPLFVRGVYGLVSLEDRPAYFGVESVLDTSTHGPGCLPGHNASSHEYRDGLGQRFSGHWVVEPGRETNRTLVTELLQLPFDTTIHYIAVHLHPFAESVTLRDITADEVLFESRARPFPDRIGLAHVDAFSSVEGLPVYRDHEYELITVYHNTTDQPQDSMSVMNLYLLDREFDRDEVLDKLAALDG